jgi:hypothetical protein
MYAKATYRRETIAPPKPQATELDREIAAISCFRADAGAVVLARGLLQLL